MSTRPFATAGSFAWVCSSRPVWAGHPVNKLWICASATKRGKMERLGNQSLREFWEKQTVMGSRTAENGWSWWWNHIESQTLPLLVENPQQISCKQAYQFTIAWHQYPWVKVPTQAQMVVFHALESFSISFVDVELNVKFYVCVCGDTQIQSVVRKSGWNTNANFVY